MGSHAGRLALAGLHEGPFITIETAPKQNMAQARSAYDTIEDSQLYFWFPHHSTTNRDATEDKKEVTASQTKGCDRGQKKYLQQCHFQMQALLQFCDLSDCWFTSRKFSPSHLRYVTLL